MGDVRLEIVRTEKHPEFGLHHWLLFGLNVFAYNDVPCAIEQRPDVLFLTDITARLTCSAHVSAMALKDRVETPEEMFGLSDGDIPYLHTRTEFYGGFFDLDTSPCFDACFFPKVTPQFWQALLREEDDLEQMILCHGLAFYVAPRLNAMAEMTRLLRLPFPGEAQWLTALTDLYGAVLIVGHDGQWFEVYSKDEDGLRLLQPSLISATTAVERSEWFQIHKQDLAWGDDLDACLMLPK
jgi:hypothetical protein